MTKEEVASIVQYCNDNGVSYKARLSELGVPEWKFFESKRRYAKEQASSASTAGGEGDVFPVTEDVVFYANWTLVIVIEPEDPIIVCIHEWSEWASNGNGTHTRTCTTGSHSETENCSGGTATCENKAVCSVCGLPYGEKLGHDYGKVKYTWTSDNTCKAERVCKHDSTHIESETVTATVTETKAATCKEKGKMKYTATFVNTAFAVQEKEVDIDFAPHTFGAWKDEIPATAEDFGTKGHKDCTVCGKHFDKDGGEITELRIAKIGTHNVIVNGESKFYADGESITVTANEPAEGKVFKGWKDASGKIVSTEKSYTFTVNGETTLTAVYEDKSSGGGEITPPAKKDGLSGGQIAGIVIGSVAVAGIGGFAIFWFAVKKKTFADLIAAIKGTPKNK